MAMSSFEAGILVACAAVLSSVAPHLAEPMRPVPLPADRSDGKAPGRKDASPQEVADGRREAQSGPGSVEPAATTGRPSSSKGAFWP